MLQHVNLENCCAGKLDAKGYVSHDSFYMKCPEQENIWNRKPGAGRGEGGK